MAKIIRFTGNVQAFGISATGTKRTVFGDVTQSDTLDDNLNADFLVGWENGVDINGFPPIQYFNAVAFTCMQFISYLHQAGLPEWDSAQEFNTGNLTQVAGVVYKSLVDSNVNFDPTSEPTKWQQIDSGTVGGYSPGNLSGNVPVSNTTLNIDLNADLLDGQHGSYYQNADNLNAGTLPAARFDDTAHGSRSGGSLHSEAVASGAAGFLSGSDKAKLDSLSSGGNQFITNANDQTGSRSLGVIYTNTTGRPMLVVAETAASASSGSPICSAFIDGVAIQQSQSNENSSAGDTAQFHGHLVFVVPVGSTYKIEKTGGSGTATLSFWSEMD